jgi:hypothetical protein
MSNINPTNIDGTYPIAGQDNDSQGFRDNFTNIRNNFSLAKSEIEDLASKAVLKSALSGGTLNNNMAGSLLSSATVRDFREARFDFGEIEGTVAINHLNGHYQTITPIGNFSLEFNAFPPAGSVGRVRLEVEITNTAFVMSLPNTVTIGTDGIIGLLPAVAPVGGSTVTFAEPGIYIYEFTTEDSGTSFAIRDLTQARDYIRSTTLRLRTSTPGSIGTTGNTAGMIAVDADNIYVCDGEYDESTPIWKAIKAGTESVSLSSPASITSNTLVDITGLGFTAVPGRTYRFDALLPFSHTSSSTHTHTFSVAFSGGTCNYVIEQQTTPSSAFSVSASSTSDSTAAAATTGSTSMRFARISGTFSHSESTDINLRAATSDGALNILAGASLSVQVVN